MKYTDAAGQKLSQMTLGTVQLGMNYGIANNAGKPDEKTDFEMLSAALANGVTSLDTARLYGTSEDVLGKFFASYKGEMPFLTTKIPHIEADSPAEIEKFIIESLEISLSRLGVKKVNCVMLHNSDNLYKNADTVAHYMGELINRGYTDMVGASVYNGDEVREIFRHKEYTATQIPMSIFDQRMIVSGVVSELEERGFTTFVRSVFLQGVFFLDPDKLTDPIMVEYAKPKIKALRELAEHEGMSIAEMAISFMRDVPGISSLVLGADNATQVKNNIKYFDAKHIGEETTMKIRSIFSDVNIPEIMKVLSRPKQ